MTVPVEHVTFRSWECSLADSQQENQDVSLIIASNCSNDNLSELGREPRTQLRASIQKMPWLQPCATLEQRSQLSCAGCHKYFLSVLAEALLVYKQHIQYLVLSVLYFFMPPKLFVFSRHCAVRTRYFAAQLKLTGATSGLIQDLGNRWTSKAEPWWPAIKEVLPGCLNNSRSITGISSRAIWLWFF